MNLNLRNRILLPTVALLLLVTAVLSFASFFMSRKALDESFAAQLEYIGDRSLRQIETWAEGHRTNLMHWAAQPQVLAALQATPAARASGEAVTADLMRAHKLYGCFANLQLNGTDGIAVACSNPEMVGKLDVSDRQYFKDAMTGKVATSQVLQNKLNQGRPIVVIAAPIMDGTTVRGVLSASLDLNTFSNDLIDKIKVLKTGHAFLYDEKGVFISHPNRELIMKAKLADFPWAAPFQAAATGRTRFVFEGVDYVASFKNSDTLHWGMVVTVPLAELLAPTYRMRRINLLVGLGAMAVGAFVMFLTARSISRPIQHIAEHLDTCSHETTSASQQVSNASQALAAGSSEQASALEEASSSLEEMSSMTKRNAESATQANDLARAAREAADGGASDMQAMGRAMTDIKSSSDDIAKIIKTIDEIAFQTNILALNAAVEAARAGEAGAGFAVVAEEVRALAQRSAIAAKETAHKIESAIAKTAQGVEISDQVNRHLAEIVEKVRQVDTLISQVATASREQNQGVQQINSSIRQMDVVVQSNAAGAEQCAAAAEELNAQAQTLDGIISTLRGLIAGHGQRSAPVAPAPATVAALPAPGVA